MAYHEKDVIDRWGFRLLSFRDGVFLYVEKPIGSDGNRLAPTWTVGLRDGPFDA